MQNLADVGWEEDENTKHLLGPTDSWSAQWLIYRSDRVLQSL